PQARAPAELKAVLVEQSPQASEMQKSPAEVEVPLRLTSLQSEPVGHLNSPEPQGSAHWQLFAEASTQVLPVLHRACSPGSASSSMRPSQSLSRQSQVSG